MKHLKSTLLLLIAASLFAACERALLLDDDEVTTTGNGSAKLRICASMYEFLPFQISRGTLSLRDVSRRISFALFDMEGEKVMATKSQTTDDANFGTFNVNLNPGQYILVTIAHNGEGNCTISSPTEIKFANNKMTDTFSSCDTIQVESGEQTAYITLQRRVAMLRLLLEETLPQNVKQLKFYYTGGSSTLDATTGYGSVNSRQTEILNVPATAYTAKSSTYDVFTLPHDERDTLKLTITALTAQGEAVAERNLVDVPVRVGEITQFRGTFVGGNNADYQGIHFELSVDDRDWTRVYYTF